MLSGLTPGTGFAMMIRHMGFLSIPKLSLFSHLLDIRAESNDSAETDSQDLFKMSGGNGDLRPRPGPAPKLIEGPRVGQRSLYRQQVLDVSKQLPCPFISFHTPCRMCKRLVGHAD